MNYLNYDTAIVQDRRAKIVGWPKHVLFANPSAIGTVGDLRTLRDDLKSGKCHWIKLTPSQLAQHTSKLDALREQGQTVGAPRKSRSDKGKKRKNAPSGNENQPPRKKSKAKGTSRKSQKSKAIIEESEGDE